MSIPGIKISDYEYDLPSERIAIYPLANRDDSKLLVYNKGNIIHSEFRRLVNYLPSDALLVFNNTRVIRARLQFKKDSGAQIEIFCLEPAEPADIAMAFQAGGKVKWNCLIRNQKKWKDGALTLTCSIKGKEITLKALLTEKEENSCVVEFLWEPAEIGFGEILDAIGHTPIPPYLERDDEEIDVERYQTVYSKYKGSVAAPTAGLHFTANTLQALKNKGIRTTELTLHVGAGTFRPVKADSIDQHKMHTEHFEAALETLTTIASHRGPVIAVGTTSLRTLESLYFAALHIAQGRAPEHIDQWEGFESDVQLTRQEAYGILAAYLEKNGKEKLEAATSIIIAPGYKPKVIDGLISNFHQPRSTLLLLIAALIGDNWKEVYRQALEKDYRFLSYGDSSLLLP